VKLVKLSLILIMKEEGIKSYLENDLNKQFGNIEKLIGLYGKDGYAVGNSLTWADLAIFDFKLKAEVSLGSLDQFEHVKKVSEKVESEPHIAEYLKKRNFSIPL
jgi:hypothetical protein